MKANNSKKSALLANVTRTQSRHVRFSEGVSVHKSAGSEIAPATPLLINIDCIKALKRDFFTIRTFFENEINKAIAQHER